MHITPFSENPGCNERNTEQAQTTMSKEPEGQLNTAPESGDIQSQLDENLRDLGLDEIDQNRKSYRYRKEHGEMPAYDRSAAAHHSHHSHSGHHSHSSYHHSHSSHHHSDSSHHHSSGEHRSSSSHGSSGSRRSSSSGSSSNARHSSAGSQSSGTTRSAGNTSGAKRTTGATKAKPAGTARRSNTGSAAGSAQRSSHRNLSKKQRKKLMKQRRRELKRERRLENRKPLPVRILIGILIALAVLLIGIIVTFLVMRHIGKKNLKPLTDQEITGPDGAQIEDNGRKIIYKGHTYLFNDDIVGILFLGVDRDLSDKEQKVAGTAGQSDTLVLGALNTKTGHMELVNVSRDTFTDVEKYNTKGKYAGTEKMQICLAYSYGDGQDKSCMYAAEAVSKLLYGMPIHAYAAVDYSQMATLNDAVDGVTVKVLEDLSDKDPAFVKGATVHLKGQQAQTYVRSRRTEELASNNSRMDRQMQYMYEYLRKARQKTKENILFPINLYQVVRDNTVSSVRLSQITYLASRFIRTGFSRGDIKSIPGTIEKENGYAALKPDEIKLFEIVLETFYEKQD